MLFQEYLLNCKSLYILNLPRNRLSNEEGKLTSIDISKDVFKVRTVSKTVIGFGFLMI